MGLPVAAAYSAPFWVPSIEDDVIEGATDLQLEKMNLKLDEGLGRLIDTRTMEATEGQTLRLATVLNEKALTAWPREIPRRFEISPNLFYLPDNDLVIWKELGKIVAILTRNGRAIQSQTLNSSSVDAQAVHDIQVLLMPLEMQNIVSELDSVRLWTDAVEPGADKWLGEALGVPVRREAKPTPTLPVETSPLLPHAIAQARVDRSKAARFRQGAMAFAAVYLIGATAFIWSCWKPMQETKKLITERDTLSQLNGWVDPEKSRWIRVLDVCHADRFALERFRQCTAMLDEKYGVRLSKFTFETHKITILIEGQDMQRNYRYLNDLKKEPMLQEYTWDSPPAGAERNEISKMNITGTLKSAAPATKS
jgi:hypothetical protein